MAEITVEVENADISRTSRPSLPQVKALVEFIQKHPDLAHRKLRNGVSRPKVKKLWVQASNILNSLDGALKNTNGWIKFWSDKRRSILLKQKQIEQGEISDTLSPIEQKIYELCQSVPPAKRKKSIKSEPFNGDADESMDEQFLVTEDVDLNHIDNGLIPSDLEERQLGMMEKLVEVMDQQAQAMAQVAQAQQNNSKALERLAEASHMQALAVDRLATSFENINSSVHDVRNSLLSIDYTLKRYYETTGTQQRQTSNLFS